MSPKQVVIILLGPPGSGKGTQGSRLSEELGIPHISTGDLFRENLARGTALGNKAKSFMEAGRLVPDDVVIAMLLDRVAMEDCIEGYFLDGFPRTLPQADAFEAGIHGRWRVRVFLLLVTEETLVERASGRMVCQECQRVYHAKFAPPITAGVCDHCGRKLQRRADDAPEVVRERLRIYRQETEPLVSFYRARCLLEELDGERTVNEVFEDLRRRVMRAA